MDGGSILLAKVGDVIIFFRVSLNWWEGYILCISCTIIASSNGGESLIHFVDLSHEYLIIILSTFVSLD